MRKLTREEFILRSVRMHGDTYDYSLVDYIDMHSNVSIICKNHGVFLQTPSNHLKGHGCSVCNKIEARKLSLKDCLRKFVACHGEKYDYSEVEYVNNRTPVKIICPHHGAFYQKPGKHFIGQGCPVCKKNYKDTTESFIKKAISVHGDLYDYSLVRYINQKVKVCIIDPKYGVFWQSPCAHLNGEGCPKRSCSKYSKPQLKMVSMLKDIFGEENVLSEYKSDEYPFYVDAYVTVLDLYIELNAFWTHGGHYFDEKNVDDQNLLKLWSSKSSKIYKTAIKTWTYSDLEKRDWALSHNLNYLVFWDNDLKDFYEWLNQYK